MKYVSLFHIEGRMHILEFFPVGEELDFNGKRYRGPILILQGEKGPIQLITPSLPPDEQGGEGLTGYFSVCDLAVWLVGSRTAVFHRRNRIFWSRLYRQTV